MNSATTGVMLMEYIFAKQDNKINKTAQDKDRLLRQHGQQAQTATYGKMSRMGAAGSEHREVRSISEAASSEQSLALIYCIALSLSEHHCPPADMDSD